MLLGTWFHNDDRNLNGQHVVSAHRRGISLVRSYTFEHIAPIVDVIRECEMSVLAGVHVDPEEVLTRPNDVSLEGEIRAYLESGVKVHAVCIGNELRDPWTKIGQWTFSEELATKFCIVLDRARELLTDLGVCELRVTYAMERPFPWESWLQPVVNACDFVSINLFPIENRHWFGPASMDANRSMLLSRNEQKLLLLKYEVALREVLERTCAVGKRVILSETGIPSGISYEWRGERILSQHLIEPWREMLCKMMDIVVRANDAYGGCIEAVYLYEWRDNCWHSKRMVEDSPAHASFGLCYEDGAEKVDVPQIVSRLSGREM